MNRITERSDNGEILLSCEQSQALKNWQVMKMPMKRCLKNTTV